MNITNSTLSRVFVSLVENSFVQFYLVQGQHHSDQYSAEELDTKTLNYNTETYLVEHRLFHLLEILACGERTGIVINLSIPTFPIFMDIQ